MTLQEHKTILAFLEHVAGSAQEPLDVEADAIIRAYFKRNPDAAYRMTKFAMALAMPVQAGKADEQEPKRRRWLPVLRPREA
ncbi:hypothetical protein [Acidocella sp.]|uniref:hypothetical protein n=1 Tax=Acidocella sp. TaxID=50710 RepID=UPI003D07B9D9